MNAATLRQSVKDINHSKTDRTGIRDMQSATAPGAKPPRNGRRKLPYEEIQRLHGQGLAGVAIAKQLGLKTRSVYSALRRLGLGPRRPMHKREVLEDGKIRCSVCKRSKEAKEFRRLSSRCKPCEYGQMAMQSNQELGKAIHIRNLWFHARAKRLGIYYDLTDEQLTELYVLQDGRCAYCREPMVMKLGIRRSGCTASIERIIPDTLGGAYTIKNVLWVHTQCNSRRWALAGERLKEKFPEASRAIERVALERQLELPFPLDSEIIVTNDPEPQPAVG